NCPNITYATTSLVGDLKDFHNLDCLIPTALCPPMILTVIPKVLMFHDCKQEVVDATSYSNEILPMSL
ncbi:hypothetical protein PAXRUDRAFT_166989, partial [Paxillus rubicundulus Ve08.2h10]